MNYLFATVVLVNLFFVVCASDDLKSSLVFVIDDTNSMTDDIEQVKLGVNSIFDTVMESKHSQIDNFILVTFNDPDIGTELTVTRDRAEFKQALNRIKVHGGGDDCPEFSMSGIERALLASLPRSYLYVFTDAAAKDYEKFEQVKALAHRRSSQVTYVLTGRCGYTDYSPGYRVYHQLAEATMGQVFHLHKTDVRQILDYVVETIKGDRTPLASANLPPSYDNKFNFTVDNKMEDVMVSISGTKPKIDVTDPQGVKSETKIIVDQDKVTILKLNGTKPGTYTAIGGCTSNSSVVVTAKTDFNFRHGFSTFKASSINDTVTRPAPDEKSYLSIKLTKGGGDVKLETVSILDMEDHIITQMGLEIVDEKNNFFRTEAFDPPKTMFKIKITGYDVETKTPITRMASTPIEAANPTVEKKENRAPTVSIEGDPKINAEYDKPLQLKCKVNAYPKPDITWEEIDTGIKLSSVVSTIEFPYDYIAILDIEKVNQNKTYRCKAINAYGTNLKEITIETKRKISFTILEYPKDTSVEYTKNGTLSCKVEAHPPATVSWYRESKELIKDDNVDISSDNSVVTIKNMQLYLKGNYTCEVTNEFNRKVYEFSIGISGVAPPIIDKNVTKLNSPNGSDADIMCNVIEGKPTPEIKWYLKRDGILGQLNETGNRIHLAKITPRESGVYRCEATNFMGSDVHETEFQALYPPVIKDDEKMIRAKDGEEITLKCNVDGAPTPTIKWYKNGFLLNTSESVQLHKDGSLRLNVSLEDNGAYNCTAVNELGEVNTSVLVDVFVPVNIESPELSTVEVKVGGRVVLPCRATGYPKPEITWIFNSSDPTIPPETTKSTGSLKKLSHIQLKDQGVYTCVATNVDGSFNISYEVKVNGEHQNLMACDNGMAWHVTVILVYPNGKVSPPIIENMYPDKTFRAVDGDLVLRVQCNATGHPKPAITWIKDGLNISDSKWYDVADDGTLFIKRIDGMSRGHYMCLAKNRFGVDTEDYQVIIDPYPIAESPTSSVLLEEGKSTAVKCDVPHGKNDSLRWYKNEQLISHGELTINDTKLSDSGLYTCRVSDSLKSRSETTSVMVGFKPRFTNEEEENIELVEDGTTYMNCDAEALPPAKVSWWRNGKAMGLKSMVHMFKTKISDEGQYMCDVSNEFGHIQRTFNLKSRDCLLNIDKEFTGNQPLMISSWPSVETADGINMRIPRDEYVSLMCPSNFKLFPNTYATAICVGDTNFRVNGEIYKYSDLKCTEEIKPIVNETGQKCLGDNTQIVNMLYIDIDGYQVAYVVCLDNVNKVPLYSIQRMVRSLADAAPKNVAWSGNDLQPFNFDDFYNCEYQLNTISKDLDKRFHADDRCCFSKRQLVSPRDAVPGLAQAATYNYLNVVPHWSSCSLKNWDEVEQRIRNLVKTIDYSLMVWTGVSSTLELTSSDSLPKQINISDRNKRKQAVPRYLWKVIIDPVTRSSLAIIQLNIPDLAFPEAFKHVHCTDICRDIHWMNNPEWRDVTKGYTYCCRLHEFVAAFGYNEVFNPRYENILYDVASISDYV